MDNRRSQSSSRWARSAEALGWEISPERLENIALILNDLERKSRLALDQDLSLVEPMFSFRPLVSEAAADEEA